MSGIDHIAQFIHKPHIQVRDQRGVITVSHPKFDGASSTFNQLQSVRHHLVSVSIVITECVPPYPLASPIRIGNCQILLRISYFYIKQRHLEAYMES
ncbi:hypothetical protein D3C84_1009620 [compost metagenome]